MAQTVIGRYSDETVDEIIESFVEQRIEAGMTFERTVYWAATKWVFDPRASRYVMVGEPTTFYPFNILNTMDRRNGKIL
jgi:hypothetical protein